MRTKSENKYVLYTTRTNNKNKISKKQQNFIKGKIKSMKSELNGLLSQPLIPKGVSAKYLTSGVVRDLADRLLDKSSCKLSSFFRFSCHLLLLLLLLLLLFIVHHCCHYYYLL